MKDTFQPATVVADNQRTDFLPSMFGANPFYFINGEVALFNSADMICEDYGGGSWTFYKADNGAHFASPSGSDSWRVSVSGNGYEGEVSTEAFGVIVSMFALNLMAERASARGDSKATDFLCDRYYELRSFAIDHPEQPAIFRAID
jgi:hypothetical protein